MRTFILLAILLSSQFALARKTFGPEFEFTNAEIAADSEWVYNDASEEMAYNMAEEIVERCGDCTYDEIQNKYGIESYKIKYPDGWWFIITTDPGVIEIQVKPMTIEEMERVKDRAERDIFKTARAFGMVPSAKMKDAYHTAGGHIHIGYKDYFHNDLNLFRNFLVDYVNHSELAGGVLAEDYANAPPLAVMQKKQIARFKKLIADIDSRKIRTIKKVVQRMNEDVYYTAYDETWAPPEKYQAVNLSRLDDDFYQLIQMTVEIRGQRSQNSFAEFISLCKMFDARIDYLKNHVDKVKLDLVNPETLTDAEKAERFYDYVTESGVSFKPYLPFLSERYAKYIQRQHPEIAKSRLTCERVLIR